MSKERDLEEDIRRRENIIQNALNEYEGEVPKSLLDKIGEEYVKIQDLRDRILHRKFREKVLELNREFLGLRDGEKKSFNLPVDDLDQVIEIWREGDLIGAEGSKIHWRLRRRNLEGKIILEPAWDY